MSFTGIRDLDYKIMEELDIRSLLNFCLTDTYISELCKNDMFWKRRFEQRIGYGKFKPVDMSWRKYYLQLLSQDISSEGFNQPFYVKENLINFLRNANFGDYTGEIRKALETPLRKKIISRVLAERLLIIWFRINKRGKTYQADENMIKYLIDGLTSFERKGFKKESIPLSKTGLLISLYFISRVKLTSEENKVLNSEENRIMLNNLEKILLEINRSVVKEFVSL